MRLRAQLVVEFRVGQRIVEAALAAGADLDDIYIEVVSPALVSIGDKWAKGDLEIYLEQLPSPLKMPRALYGPLTHAMQQL